MALLPGVGEAARGRDAAHRALGGGGARARRAPPHAAHGARAAAAYR